MLLQPGEPPEDLHRAAACSGQVRACTSSSDRGCPTFRITAVRPSRTAVRWDQQLWARGAGDAGLLLVLSFSSQTIFFLAAGAELVLPFTFSLNFFSCFAMDLSLLARQTRDCSQLAVDAFPDKPTCSHGTGARAAPPPPREPQPWARSLRPRHGLQAAGWN